MNTPEIKTQQVPPFGGGGGEAIILAGGLGTRLRSVVSDLPKCMAPVAGKPFLGYVIEYLQKQSVTHFIFSTGYMSGAIEKFLEKEHPSLNYTLSVEEEPLGTGGAIYLACTRSSADDVLALNGDTMFTADVNGLLQFHKASNAECTLALKPMQQFDRYGVVEMDAGNRICSFKEKKYYDTGLINGGVYAINRGQFLSRPFPGKFSFEKDYLEAHVSDTQLYGFVQDRYFIDIGIPQDYERAQTELAALKL